MKYVLLGGTPRASALRKLEAKIEGEWEWVESRKIRLLTNLVQRVNAGKIDHLFILNRFVSHMALDLVLGGIDKERMGHVHFLERGYGLREIMEVLP